PSKVYPDSDFNLSLGIGNAGGDKAESVKISLGLPAEIEGENTASLGTISSSGTATASFNLKCLKNAESKTYNVPVDIDYIDEKGVEQTLKRSFELFVDERGDIKIQIAGISTAPTKIYPNTDFTLSITLENTGDQNAKSVKVDLELPAVFSGETTAFLGTLTKDGSSTPSFDLKASKETKAGETYNVVMKIRYEDETGVEHQAERTFDVFVLERGAIKLDISGVSTSPSKIYSDTDFTLSTTLENSGDQDAKSVSLNLVLPEGFTGETTAFLGTIKEDTSSTASFDLKTSKETKAGEAYIVAMKIGYEDENGMEHSGEKTFDIFVNKRGSITLEIAGVSTSPTKVYPGSDFTLSIQLENTGTQDAKSVKAEISPPEQFIGERLSFIGEIEQDDVSSGIFDLRISKKTKPGSYDIPMKIVYSDEVGTEYTKEKYFGIFVDKKPRRSLVIPIIVGAIISIAVVYFWRRRRVEV
ncbi:MAG: COG1361 S-layer family protein, partial [Candidatus Hydrothermarchaeales archaeon]